MEAAITINICFFMCSAREIYSQRKLHFCKENFLLRFTIFQLFAMILHYVIYWGDKTGRYVNAIDGPLVKVGGCGRLRGSERARATDVQSGWIAVKKRLFKTLSRGMTCE